LNKEFLARYNLTRVELELFNFSKGAQSQFIDIAVPDPVPKSLVLTKLKIPTIWAAWIPIPTTLDNMTLFLAVC
jgi:hypothetical protein